MDTSGHPLAPKSSSCCFVKEIKLSNKVFCHEKWTNKQIHTDKESDMIEICVDSFHWIQEGNIRRWKMSKLVYSEIGCFGWKFNGSVVGLPYKKLCSICFD